MALTAPFTASMRSRKDATTSVTEMRRSRIRPRQLDGRQAAERACFRKRLVADWFLLMET